jgi:hydroxymethylbilane synthase
LRKVDQGQVHAAILAAAGLIRLNAQQHIKQFLEPPEWLPAAGQGAIAVQLRSDDEEMKDLLRPLHHAPTDVAVRAERAFLSALEGGCQVPIGALVIYNEGGTATLYGFVSDIGGKDPVRGSFQLDLEAPEESGRALAADLRTRGATSLLM